jgi:ATP-dependent Lon protease
MADDTPVVFDFPSSTSVAIGERARERELPVVPLINVVLFPHMLTPLFVGRERSVTAIEEALVNDRLVLAVAQRDPELERVGPEDVYTIGVEATIQRVLRMPDGSTSVVVQGTRRVRVLETVREVPALRMRVEAVDVDEEKTLAVEALMRAVLALFERVVKLSRTLPDDSYIMALNVDEPGWLADLIASTLPLDIAHRQVILETLDPEERLRRLSAMLSQELDVLELESRIHNQVQKEVDRSQREFFLREQLKAIQRELGQEDPTQRELQQLRDRLARVNLSERAARKAEEELGRLELMPLTSPEYTVARTYLEWLLDLPWNVQSQDNEDLVAAAQTLDRNHYGLAKIKDRIVEFLAVRQLAGAALKAPILCFVGPPGVGKTSLGRSIAEALGRKFVRLSLGGLHDEAEIRGHRRTYIGSLPGRIIRTMKEAGTVNPVFVLDEIDKLGRDFRGDPAAALLEVLDPEQNHSFSDHYLDVPYDLSQVLWITTANLLDPIPSALRDRLEVIELPGYTEDEKLQIARQFLVPRQITTNGLPPGTLRFTDDALHGLMRGYTHEAGVRGFEREIGAVCRKTARRVAEGRSFMRRIGQAQVERLLGPPRYTYGTAEEAAQIGAALGLAWTSRGGDTMVVEVMLMEGRGALLLTGQLGEVMRESAQAALSFIKSNAQRLGIELRRFDKLDIHLHLPEGAVPKDGPSAGITLATALVSALSDRPVRHDVAMTGEITLRGRVLPVGGVKEKVLGAHRAGIARVILPSKNERDLLDIPVYVRRQIAFCYVDHIDQVLEAALLDTPPSAKAPSKIKKKQKAKAHDEQPAPTEQVSIEGLDS